MLHSKWMDWCENGITGQKNDFWQYGNCWTRRRKPPSPPLPLLGANLVQYNYEYPNSRRPDALFALQPGNIWLQLKHLQSWTSRLVWVNYNRNSGNFDKRWQKQDTTAMSSLWLSETPPSIIPVLEGVGGQDDVGKMFQTIFNQSVTTRMIKKKLS